MALTKANIPNLPMALLTPSLPYVFYNTYFIAPMAPSQPPYNPHAYPPDANVSQQQTMQMNINIHPGSMQ